MLKYLITNDFFYSHKFDYTDMELGSVSLLGDISLVGGYSLSRVPWEQVFVFINQSIMQLIDIYLIVEKGFV